MYRCIIVDDEPHAIEGLKAYIASLPELAVYKTYTDPIKALIEIPQWQSVDLIFLDVDMPGVNGIELAKQTRRKTKKLIFTTAHSQYGYQAFEVDADDFLLKPYSLSKFISTIQKHFPKAQENDHQDTADEQERSGMEGFFFVKSKDDDLKLIKINIKDIIAVESKLNYVQIHTPAKSILTYMSLSQIGKKLLVFPHFLQFQRSFILSQDHISYIDGNSVTMINGVTISVGNYYKKHFQDFVESRLLKARQKST